MGLKKLSQQRQLTRVQLADATDVTQQSISDYEHGVMNSRKDGTIFAQAVERLARAKAAENNDSSVDVDGDDMSNDVVCHGPAEADVYMKSLIEAAVNA
jgi:transcriptional regulator with XRE-family HTH domain